MSSKRDEIMALIRHHGLTVETIGAGPAVRVTGPGVHVVAASLDWLKTADIRPVTNDRQVKVLNQVPPLRLVDRPLHIDCASAGLSATDAQLHYARPRLRQYSLNSPAQVRSLRTWNRS